MKRYVAIFLPKGITQNRAMELAGEWFDHLYFCGSIDQSIVNDIWSIGKKYILILKIKSKFFCWLPDRLNGPNAPEGMAIYMNKRNYKNFIKEYKYD